jgi:hypothetical protein
VRVAAETHLLRLAESLERAQPHTRLKVSALKVQAVANAFAMLGLVTAERAQTAMQRAGAALELHGLAGSWLAAGPGPAASYWSMRAQAPAALAWAPRAVAVGDLRFSVAGAALRCSWFRASRAGLRFQLHAAAEGVRPPEHVREALAELSASDDRGLGYRLRWDGGRGSRRLWTGEVVARPGPVPGTRADLSWFWLAAAGGRAGAGRVDFAPPPPIASGPAAPPQPTAAESYLDWLGAQDPGPELTRPEVRQVVAAVAEGLVAARAVPAGSPVLPPIMGRNQRSSHPDLPQTWPRPVRLGTRPDLQIALGAALPLEHASVVIEGLSAWGEDIQLRLYGWPWVQGRHWPGTVPSFKVLAIDDLGGEHRGQPGGWRDYGAGEAHGEFTLWPAVPRRAGRLRVVISTLWEAGWADIELPGR